MGRYRHMFAVPIACMAMLAALVLYSPPVTMLDYGPAYTVGYDLHDLSLPAAYVDKVALLAEDAATDVPRDAHRVAYTIENQPLSVWRFAVDAYSHVDPGRRLI